MTDADLVLGYIPADYFLGGDIKLDVQRSHQAVARVGGKLEHGRSTRPRQAMFTTINTVMANLITEVCTKKGHDVRDFTLVAGGGAGGIHAAAIAQQLSIPMVIVPRVAALMSAFGMFAMDLGPRICALLLRAARTSWTSPRSAACTPTCAGRRATTSPASAFREAQLSFQPTVEMRYAGQFHEVEIDLPAETLNAENLPALLQNFHGKYEKMYTYSMPWRAAEFLTFRLKVTAPAAPVETGGQRQGRRPACEIARRGSRRCLFDGSAKRVEPRSTTGIGWSPATRSAARR